MINKLVPYSDKDLAVLVFCRLAFHVLCSIATPLFFLLIELTENGWSDDLRMVVFREQATRLNELMAATQTTHDIATSVQKRDEWHSHCHSPPSSSTCSKLYLGKQWTQDDTSSIFLNYKGFFISDSSLVQISNYYNLEA